MTATTTSPVQKAQAMTFRIDQGYGPKVSLSAATEEVKSVLVDTPRDQWPEIMAYLACQVVGLRNSQDSHASLAMHQVEAVVREWRQRQG